MNAYIDSLLNEFDGMKPGGSVLAGNLDDIVYIKNFGLANLEHNIPVSDDSVFNIASVSKPITALGIMLMVEKGVISLEDELINFFPEFYQYYKGIKLKHLLNHTSGIKNYYDILRQQHKTCSDFSNLDFYKLMTENMELDFKPGDKFDYSNSGYVFLSLLIERVTGDSFNNFMYKNIFKPLGMKNTYINTETKPVLPNLAYGYRFMDESYYCDYTSTYTLGDGGVFSTAYDIYLLMRKLLKGSILSDDVLNLMMKPGHANDGSRIPYGYGWEIKLDSDSNIIYHSGLDAGYRNLLTIDTSCNAIVVLLSNNAQFSYKERVEITSEILKAYKKHTFS